MNMSILTSDLQHLLAARAVDQLAVAGLLDDGPDNEGRSPSDDQVAIAGNGNDAGDDLRSARADMTPASQGRSSCRGPFCKLLGY
ncbi:hypothetical protein PAHAL_5G138900 [Panicum hallii]|uniref:Uncharacterized protein n=1 Tax=Panicum hallii TaxID=206008 RepID=A0A2S3HR72_9POAL|nr:hypothetical protein PAHAL_5G138900 [Panicum hallii]